LTLKPQNAIIALFKWRSLYEYSQNVWCSSRH
jgi:hypothetical protein